MKNILFISLGCDKNLVDSEKMIGLLDEAGYRIVQEEDQADVIVVNTCCFIHDAKEESIETILEMARWKEYGRLKLLVVAGCLGQRYEKEIKEAIPEVDGIIGTSGYAGIVEMIDELLQDAESCRKGEDPAVAEILSADQRPFPVRTFIPSVDLLPDALADKRITSTGAYSSFLKIAEGCNKMCSYCIIPYIRGHYRSFPMEDLVKEAELLAAGGVKELILVAQETTVYGIDRYGKKMLPELLRRLCRIEGLAWIRLLYCYPEEITDELIQVIKEEEKICHYLDMPIQHSEDRILRAMGRRTNREELTRLIAKLREEIPDIALRTTLITGFPGETEEDFANMLDFVDRMEFDRLGVFPYSAEEGTKAAEMDLQVPEEVKEDRRDQIMLLQREICMESAEKKIGQVLPVLIEGYLFDEDVYVGRTFMDAPKVDGNVFVSAQEELISGDIVPVKITGASEYDLIGDVIYADEFAE